MLGALDGVEGAPQRVVRPGVVAELVQHVSEGVERLAHEACGARLLRARQPQPQRRGRLRSTSLPEQGPAQENVGRRAILRPVDDLAQVQREPRLLVRGREPSERDQGVGEPQRGAHAQHLVADLRHDGLRHGVLVSGGLEITERRERPGELAVGADP